MEFVQRKAAEAGLPLNKAIRAIADAPITPNGRAFGIRPFQVFVLIAAAFTWFDRAKETSRG
jgi:hypothetical protein